MKLSIIIPVYNIEKYIARCLDSILTQGYKNYEIIIIDDGSNDNSIDVCKFYQKNDNRIKIYSQKNSGVSSARNKGIELSNGDWICFVDGDDFIENNSLNNIIKSVNDNAIDCIIARSFINNGNKIGEEKYAFDRKLINKNYEGVRLAIDNNYFKGSIWGVLYKKELLINNAIKFPPGIKNGEDAIFFSQVLLFAKAIKFMDVHFYNVYEREGSASRSWSFDRIFLMVNNINYLQNYITNNQNLTKEQRHIINYDIYRAVSSIFNSFSECFSVKNWFRLNSRIDKVLNNKLDIGEIKISKNKVKLLNTSVFLYSITVLFKNLLR